MSVRDDNTRRATAQAGPALSRRAFAGLAGLAGAGLVTGCSSGLKGSTSSAAGTVKIGFVSPMTGPDAAFATANPFVLKKVRRWRWTAACTFSTCLNQLGHLVNTG